MTDDGLTYQVLCCKCGQVMKPNPSGMCANCLKRYVDITQNIDEEQSIYFCRQCYRYSQNGDKYMPAELESPALMGILLQKIRGLKDVKILDAKFIWQEPHSKRIKILLTVEKQVLGATITQQQEVTFHVITTMCQDCQYTYTEHTWSYCVQVRQRTSHKRTLLYLESCILKKKEGFKILNIETQPDGLDFFFTDKSECYKFINFIQTLLPCQHHEATKLVSADVKSNIAFKKHTIILEVADVCKDDLVVIPKKLRRYTGSVQGYALVYKIAQRIYLVDPITGQTAAITPAQYFSCPFKAIMTRRERIYAECICVQDDGVQVQTEHDMEMGDIFLLRTHLQGILHDEQFIYVYNVENLDDQENDVKNHIEQKYVIICRTEDKEKLKAKRQKKKQDLKQEDVKVEDYQDDDLDYLCEVESNQGELQQDVIEDVDVGFCPE